VHKLFHPISLIIPLIVLLPNLIFFRMNSSESNRNKEKENPVLSAAEGIGRIGVFLLPVFSVIHVVHFYEMIALLGMLISIAFYYFGWIRYFIRNREFRLLFTPIMGIPVPMAISPSVYFLFAAVVLHSPYLFISSLILAAGHIPISLNTNYRNQQSQ
jgi:hypothetical protein